MSNVSGCQMFPASIGHLSKWYGSLLVRWYPVGGGGYGAPLGRPDRGAVL